MFRMRVLVPAPRVFSADEVGSYVGPLPRVDAAAGILRSVAKRKRWFYFAIATDRVWIALGIVRTGYAATAFAFVHDLKARRMLAEATVLAPAVAARITDDPHGAGRLAIFLGPGGYARVERTATEIGVHAAFGRTLHLDATLDEIDAPPPITAIGKLGEGLWDATEKRALVMTRGRVIANGEEIGLSGAIGGWDYTHGILPRHTTWRWAFALGKDAAGAPIALNLVSGFVGEAECVAWTKDGIHPLGEPRFTFDRERPLEPWRLEGEGVALTFQPGAVHRQSTNLGVVRSRFIQPAGTFSGTLGIDGREVRVDGLPGVVEDQDVLW